MGVSDQQQHRGGERLFEVPVPPLPCLFQSRGGFVGTGADPRKEVPGDTVVALGFLCPNVHTLPVAGPALSCPPR